MGQRVSDVRFPLIYPDVRPAIDKLSGHTSPLTPALAGHPVSCVLRRFEDEVGEPVTQMPVKAYAIMRSQEMRKNAYNRFGGEAWLV